VKPDAAMSGLGVRSRQKPKMSRAAQGLCLPIRRGQCARRKNVDQHHQRLEAAVSCLLQVAAKQKSFRRFGIKIAKQRQWAAASPVGEGRFLLDVAP